MKYKKIYPFLLIVLLFMACNKHEKKYYEEKGAVFHTFYQIKYEAEKPVTEKIQAEFRKFNLSLNPFDTTSIITKINRNEPVEVDEWFAEVFTKAQEVSRNSGGVFDITCAPLINLWGFGFSNKDQATPQAIDSVMQFVGYEKVRLEGKKVVKDDPRIQLNCSAIAKGYSCDIIARLLEKEGIENYMVNIGGEIVVKGLSPTKKCWSLGINRPQFDTLGISNDWQERLVLCGKKAVATSGNYRNFHIKEGKMYAHTIDPSTGYPARDSILSATIVADDCITADAYATAFMAMGMEKAVEMAKHIPEIEYLIIYGDEEKQKVKYSLGMVQYMPDRQELSLLENP